MLRFSSRPRREKSPLDDSTNDSIDDHEEEFYYTEVELGAASSPPTLSHRDMARPPHEGKRNARFIFIFFFFLKLNLPKFHQLRYLSINFFFFIIST